MAEVSDQASPATGRLLLLANDAAEVPLISALVQDAVVHPVDVVFDARARRLVLLLSRFRWEAGDATRVRCALRLEHVAKLQRRAWRPGDVPLDLLAITAASDDPGGGDPASAAGNSILTLAFAAGPTLRAEVECIDLILEDVSEPWPASSEPAHHDDR